MFSFFSLVSLFLLSLTIQTKDTGRDMRSEINQEKFVLPAFSHLVIKDGCNVRLSYSPSDKLEIGYFKDLVLEKPIYSVAGDTLTIVPFPEQKGFFTNLYCSNLKSISITNARLDITEYKQSKLVIDELGSHIYTYSNSTIDTLDLRCINSNFRIDGGNIKYAQLSLKKSGAELYLGKIEEMKAELSDTSNLSTNKVLLSNIKTDESSRYFSR